MTMRMFGYRAILRSDQSRAVTSVIAYEVQSTAPLRAVMWSVPRKAWIYGPQMAGIFLRDPSYRDRIQRIDRAEAERIAQEFLKSELPTEQTLLEMLDEGERMAWEFGPPRK